MTYTSPEVGPAEDAETTGLIAPHVLEFRCGCGKVSNIRIGLYREREKTLLKRIARLTDLLESVKGYVVAAPFDGSLAAFDAVEAGLKEQP